jgi:hypothetical protein
MFLVWQCFDKIWLWTHWIGGSNTKLLQVVSLQNHFQKSNGDQNSDLVKFKGSKCVHVSSFNFFESRVFYMFWGIHRLQICRNWMCRTFSMNYLVRIGTFCHLKIISKLCTVIVWYYCMIGFYTFQGFQGYEICKSWPSRLFSRQFTSSGHIMWFEFQNWNQNWPGLTGSDWTGYVATYHWAIPIRVKWSNLGPPFRSSG